MYDNLQIFFFLQILCQSFFKHLKPGNPKKNNKLSVNQDARNQLNLLRNQTQNL